MTTLCQFNRSIFKSELLKYTWGWHLKSWMKSFPDAWNYNLRRHPEFASRAINTVHCSSESLSFLGPKIREMLPLDLKNSDSLGSFKSGIKKLTTTRKRYFHQVGFTQKSKWFWLWLFQTWSHRVVKHTQTIHLQEPSNSWIVFDRLWD